MNLVLVILLLGSLAGLQSTLGPHLLVFGVKPDLVLIAVVSWGILRGRQQGILWALIGGLSLGLLSGEPVWVVTLPLIAVAFLATINETKILKTNLFLPAIAVGFATIIYDLLLIILDLSIHHYLDWQLAITTVILPAMLLNMLVAIPLFPLIGLLNGWQIQRKERSAT